MSINSKIRREANKRSAGKTKAGNPPEPPIEPHAELRNEQGQLLAGIVRRDNEWVLGLGGRIAGQSDSAAHVLAMIQRAAILHEQAGTPVRLKFSDALRDAAYTESAALGISFEQFADELARKMGKEAVEE